MTLLGAVKDPPRLCSKSSEQLAVFHEVKASQSAFVALTGFRDSEDVRRTRIVAGRQEGSRKIIQR
jgi:hypothetical protein